MLIDGHPDLELLRRWILGLESSEKLVDEIESHVAECQVCAERAAALDTTCTDRFESLLRETKHRAATETISLGKGYEILDEVGRGASGIVYRARHRGLDRVVAVKKLLAGSSANKKTLERFQSETKALARLKHRNIVQVFDVGELEGVPFLAMEFVSGTSLSKYLRETFLNERDAAELVANLADALEHAHQQNVLHRDLKPDNVLIQANPDTDHAGSDSTRSTLGERLRVVDFGLARLTESDTHTRTGETLGTPSYMAPEQVQAKPDSITAATDVYGLGAVLYECLSGRPPFHGNSPIETIRMVVEREPVSLRQLQPGLSRDLSVICHRCLAKNPASRFSSAGELRDDLNRFLSGRPIVSRPISPTRRLQRWVQRNPWPTTVALLVSLAIIAAIVGQFVYQRQVAQQRDKAVQNYQSARAAIWEMLGAASDESIFDIPRLQQLRSSQLESATQLFETLAMEEQSAQAYRDLGNVQMMHGSCLIAKGEIEAGQRRMESAMTTFEKLVALEPDDAEFVSGLASSQVKLAFALGQKGRHDEALGIVEAAIPLAESLHEKFPDDVVHANVLAWVHHNRGTILVDRKRKPDAEIAFQNAIELRKQALANDTDNDELLRYLAESQISLASCQMASQPDSAKESFDNAIATLEKVLSRNPDDAEAMISIGTAQLNRCNLLLEPDPNDAINACTDGIQVVKKVLTADAGNRRALNCISMLYGNRAMFKTQTVGPEQAIDDWHKAIEHSVADHVKSLCARMLITDLTKTGQWNEASGWIKSEMKNGDSPVNQSLTWWGLILNQLEADTQQADRQSALKKEATDQIKALIQSAHATGKLKDGSPTRKLIQQSDDLKSFRKLEADYLDQLLGDSSNPAN